MLFHLVILKGVTGDTKREARSLIVLSSQRQAKRCNTGRREETTFCRQVVYIVGLLFVGRTPPLSSRTQLIPELFMFIVSLVLHI
jgi:hypothetical protein